MRESGWHRRKTPYKRLPAKLRTHILMRDHFRCKECGQQDGLQVDHIVPVYKGGNNHPNNLATLCRSCHTAKTMRQHPNRSRKPTIDKHGNVLWSN